MQNLEKLNHIQEDENHISSAAKSVSGDYHFKRTRLNELFTEAMKYPLIVVCAGAGYGKTTSVYDFVQEYQTSVVWVQLSERDNFGGRFWENFNFSMMQINPAFGESLKKLGFPDTAEKINQFINFLQVHAGKKRRIIVFDDCHYIENPAVMKFVEEAINNLPIGITLFLISRSTPKLNTAGLISGDLIYNISEDELKFTPNEISQYFKLQNISLQPDSLRQLMNDTEGWAFAINYIARTYKKAPGYEGYLRNAMKSNIFRFMESEIWNYLSEPLQIFLVRLSLIDHLSVDLISQLAGSDKNLIDELERQNAYVRRDTFINTFLIHPLFLEFLATKQNILKHEQIRETYTIAGVWCNQNGFKIDALSYYEKIKDYTSIVNIFIGSPPQIPYDISCFTADILERASQDVFDTILFLASTHLRTIICKGLFKEAEKKAAEYEKRFKAFPDGEFKRRSLSSIYYCWAIIRTSMCIFQDVYDFDLYYEKLSKCYSNPIDPGNLIVMTSGPWICAVGTSRKGALEDYINAVQRGIHYISKCFIEFNSGEDDLGRGEIKFYQGDMQAAEALIAHGMNLAYSMKRYGLIHRGLFYLLRINVLQGNFEKAEKNLQEMKTNVDLNHPKYFSRFIDYDISLCWYYCMLGIPEKVPDWLKDNFSLYAHAGYVENYANQMKGRYCYVTRDFSPLLSYINDMKQRESYLFGRIEMLAIEACTYYKLKDKEKALLLLEEAYENASPNNIIMPFIELGKDMRTLTSFAMKKQGKIPKSWLEEINRKSASYSKRLAHVITEYKQAKGISDNIIISPRENEILTDLSHGLSRYEIASSRNLSINTVKMLINNIYMKLGAENLAEAIRIAAERKII